MIIELLSPDELNRLNKLIEDYYGKVENLPYFRLVWANDQFEQRWMEYTNEGFKLIHPEVREVRKYSYIRNKYVLEGLQEVPLHAKTQLTGEYSYEPFWTFEDRRGDFLKPIWPAIRIILETARYNQEHPGRVKYIDPEWDTEASQENKEKRLKEIESMLFGNETATTDALAYREGVVVPSNFQTTQQVN